MVKMRMRVDIGGARRRLAMSLSETEAQLVQVGRGDLATILNWFDALDGRGPFDLGSRV